MTVRSRKVSRCRKSQIKMLLRSRQLWALPLVLLAIHAHPFVPPNDTRNPSTPDVPRLPLQGLAPNLDTRDGMVDWGEYTVWMWKFLPVYPTSVTAPALSDFYRGLGIQANAAAVAQTVTSPFSYTSGALRLDLTTVDGRPIDWDFAVWFAMKSMRMAERGWAAHYAMLVKEKGTGLGLLISLQVVGAAVGYLGGGLGVRPSVQVIPGS